MSAPAASARLLPTIATCDLPRRHLEGAIVGREEAVAQQLRASLEGFTEHAILDRVRYYRIHDYAEQMALVAHLPQARLCETF